jgi:tetratricopeptide (TPR) repeat protein
MMGRFDDSIREIKRAQELDPLSLIINAMMGMLYLDMRQPDRAMEQLKKTVALDPNFSRAHLFLTFAYEAKGMYEEAIAEDQKNMLLDGVPQDVADKYKAALSEAYKTGGAKGYWQKKAEAALDFYHQGVGIPTYAVASTLARAGDRERAYEWLEKSYKERDATLLTIRSDPAFDGMRDEARYLDMIRRIGFP